jgi:hypothetical protein
MRTKIVVSAGVILHLNGKPFGKVKTFQWSSATPRKPQYGLDALVPFELIATPTRLTGRIGLYRTVGDAGAEGANMVALYRDLPREKYYSLALIERASDTTIFEARYCSTLSQTWSAPEKGIVTGDIEFEAIEYNSEIS